MVWSEEESFQQSDRTMATPEQMQHAEQAIHAQSQQIAQLFAGTAAVSRTTASVDASATRNPASIAGDDTGIWKL